MSAARPLRYARGHLLFGEGEQIAALYRLPTVSYAHLTVGDKSAVLWALAGLAYKIGVDFRIARVARLLDPATYRAQAEAMLDPHRGDPDRWQALLDEHVEMMHGEPVYIPEVFLCATLGGGAPRRRGVLARLDALLRRTEDVAGVGRTMPITGQGLEELRDREHQIRDRLVGYLGDVRPATTMELQWLFRRAPLRHVAEPTLDEHWRPEALVLPTDDGDISYEPITSVWAQIDDAELTRHGDHLELAVTGRERQVSRQAMLRLGALPEQTEFPGRTAELMFDPLDAMDTPVDVFLDVQWVGNRKALSETRGALKEARQAIRGAVEADQDPGEMRHSRAQLADELRSYLESEAQPPLLDATLTYAVGAPTERELRRRVTALRDRLNTITLHQTAGLQEDLYYDSLVHPVKGRVDDGRRPLLIEQVGAMVPQATRTAGDAAGVYIGYTFRGGGRRGEPVLLDLTAAGRENTSPGVLMVGAPGGGKALALDTPIPTPDGWTTMGELRRGDRVFDEHGQACRVVQATEVMHDHACYEVNFSDGSTVVADAEHRWSTFDLRARQARTYAATSRKRPRDAMGGASRHRGVALHDCGRWIAQASVAGRNHYLGLYADEEQAARVAADFRGRHALPQRAPELSIRTTEQIRDSLKAQGKTNHAIPLAKPLAYPARNLPVDPYVLGVWLGDGSSWRAEITSADPEVREEVEACGYPTAGRALASGRCPQFGIGGGFSRSLRELKLLQNKYIPAIYLTSGIEQRLAMLQGLMDTDGYVDPASGKVEFTTTSYRLSECVHELVVSLGMKCRVRESEATLNGRVTGPKYRLLWMPQMPVFRLHRKLKHVKPPTSGRTSRTLRYIVDVRPVPSVPVRCIAVDSESHLYLAGLNCIPTHNTVSSLGIAYVAGLARGSSLMDGDPKDDHDLVDLPALAGSAQRLVLEGSDPRNRGSLDPLIIAPQGLREDTTLSYLLEVLPADRPGEWETELAHAIRATITAGGGSLDLIDTLRGGNPAAHAAARALEVIADTGFGSLAFGHGEESPIMQADTSAITITLSGIELPAEGIPRASYTRNDKLAVATTQLVSTAIMRRATRDVSEHVVVFLDEAWVFLASAAGQALLAKLLRLLRAFNATVIIGTQTLHELGNLDELIGTRFVFRQDSPDAARRALRVLGRDPDDEGLAKRLADPKIFRGGHCLMRDRYGRVTEMQTEFPAWLLEQLRTDPAARAARRAAQTKPEAA